jgi:DNA-binding NtrC family response regulator
LINTPYILTVESNPILAKILLRILKNEMNWQARVAVTIEEALATIRTRLPMLLLVDEFLLDGDGIALYDRVHHYIAAAPLPTILLSRDVYRCQQLIGRRQITCLHLPPKRDDLAQAISRLTLR